jgi:cyclic pyranopterin phosphate synthase
MVEGKLSHLDEHGRARMVDVGAKAETDRWAVARASVVLSPDTVQAIREGEVGKGDVRRTAEVAGVLAAKRTAELIPLCHPVALNHIEVTVEPDDSLPGLRITATARARARTGVEMEALTAAAVAALTVYDMIKGLERGARVTDLRLVEKHGGKSGDYVLDE